MNPFSKKPVEPTTTTRSIVRHGRPNSDLRFSDLRDLLAACDDIPAEATAFFRTRTTNLDPSAVEHLIEITQRGAPR
ncbi:hypothetical protein ACFPPE_07435 [Agromyces tardus]|uniref:hypothetical protein n=1 Tax=Agromyces tardus TaxID=2583849 RepID=UPI00360EB5F4